MRSRVIIAALMLFIALSRPVYAQIGYFGQNKVQYRTFDFRVLKTDHFDIYYYPEEEASARMAARMAERWYGRLSGIFARELRNRQVVVFYASGSQFRQTNVIEGDLGEGTGGVTEAYKRRIVLPFAGPIQATDHVLGHELVHAFQYDITSTSASGAAAGNAGVESLPLWFIEGMAEYLSIGPDDPNTAMWMREAIRRDRFPTIDKLDNPRYFPYRYGQALWAFIGGRYGDQAVSRLLRAGIGRDGYKGAFQRVLGVTTNDLSQQWHDATVAAYRPVAEATRMASAFARPLVVDSSKEGGGLNVSPELSPDGSRIVFFSSRDLFSIDLYVADAATGKIIRKINQRVESLRRDRRVCHVSEPHAPVELGHRVRPDPVRHPGHHTDAHRFGFAAGDRRGRDARAPDRSRVLGDPVVSLQPRAARGFDRRAAPDHGQDRRHVHGVRLFHGRRAGP
jgi:hypothetical protein